MEKRKFYVVWEGYQPGIYDSWEECKAQVEGYHGAKFKSFGSCEEATEAFRRDQDASLMKFYTFLTRQPVQHVNYEAFPEIRLDAIAVDGACNKNPGGNVEYQGVRVGTGERIFHAGPFHYGSNNIGEYLGIVHALALFARQGDGTTPIYSDSATALSWVRHRGHRSKVQFPPESPLPGLLARADNWLQTHTFTNPILKWDTAKWGEIPADFGRK